jgi:hypothetical protein
MFPAHRRYFRVGRRDLAYLKFIIEAYDGLATLSTVEREGAIVSITSPSCRAADLDQLNLGLVALAVDFEPSAELLERG